MRITPTCLVLFLVLLLAPVFAHAAESPDLPGCAGAKALPRAEAERVLNAAQTSYAKVESIHAQFIQISFLSALEVSERSTGEVWFAKPGKMRWDYREPEEQRFLMVDRTIWFHQPAQNQVIIDQVEEVLLSDLPVAFLLGVGDLSRDFELISGCRSLDGIVLELSEKGLKKGAEGKLKSFRLLIDPDSYLPAGARIVDIGDNVTALFLKNIKSNEKIGSDLFQAEFPKGTDITDRRNERPHRELNE